MVENVVTRLFLALGIIVLAAKVAGYVSRRLGQPAVLGELVIGTIPGPSVLNVIGSLLLANKQLEGII